FRVSLECTGADTSGGRLPHRKRSTLVIPAFAGTAGSGPAGRAGILPGGFDSKAPNAHDSSARCLTRERTSSGSFFTRYRGCPVANAPPLVVQSPVPQPGFGGLKPARNPSACLRPGSGVTFPDASSGDVSLPGLWGLDAGGHNGAPVSPVWPVTYAFPSPVRIGWTYNRLPWRFKILTTRLAAGQVREDRLITAFMFPGKPRNRIDTFVAQISP